MKWNLSYRLDPAEDVLEEDEFERKLGLQAMYSYVLTDRRVLFRFNSLNTKLTQSFTYGEIQSADTVSRLMVRYLKITSAGRDYLINVRDPEGLAAKLMENKGRFAPAEAGRV